MARGLGVPIVLTAPLTESIDHAGFFIQMSLACIPQWMEWVIDKKYPTWRSVPVDRDGRAGTAPAGLRVLEAVLTREFGADHVVVCCPDQLARFVRKATRIVAVPTHNPLGTTLMEARLIVAKSGTTLPPVVGAWSGGPADSTRDRALKGRHEDETEGT